MKKMRRLIGTLLIMCMVVALNVHAPAAEKYTYTVRVFAGAQGTINGKDVYIKSEIPYGGQFTFDINSVSLNSDSKYYVKGIRESGKDNNTVDKSSFVVTSDIDYVVAYGIKGSSVAYTVNYQDESGSALLPSSTYYGNVGDKPVVAYQYVDGYQPQAYNLTKTLSENESENVFTFVYTPIEGPTAGGGQGVVGGTEGRVDNTTGGGGAGTGAAGTPGAAGAAGAGDGTGATGAAGDGTGTVVPPTEDNNTVDVPDDQTPAAGPQELVDLDDPDTPLANFEGNSNQNSIASGAISGPISNASGMSTGLKVGLGAGAAAVLALIIGFAIRKRKKRNEE